MSTKRVAVITGTSTGFGYDAAQKFALAGFTVYGTMRDTAGRNAGPKAQLEAQGVTVLDVDVTDQTTVDRAAETVVRLSGGVDVLVNNAGTAHFGIAEAFSPESLERQYATNVVGPHRINRAFLPAMRARKSGLVVFVSSVVGRFTLPFIGVYASSKWALEALAESMSYELRPLGIDVAIVEPGAYATNIGNVTIVPDDQARVAAYGATAKAGEDMSAALVSQAGDPGEVGAAILALAQLPAGTRPLRTTVPGGPPADAINTAVAPIQHAVIENFGLGAFLPKLPVPV